MGTELIPQVGETIICLKVGKIDREDLYEMTRKYWKMSLQRASKANHVLAVVDGINSVPILSDFISYKGKQFSDSFQIGSYYVTST